MVWTSRQRTGRAAAIDRGENRRKSVGEGRGCRTSAEQTPALLDWPSIRGVSVDVQLPIHSPPQTAGRAGDVACVRGFPFTAVLFPSSAFVFCIYKLYLPCIIQTIMRRRKLFTKEKAKNGEGRQAVIKHLLLPEEVVKELRLYKDAYSVCLAREKDQWGNPIPVQVTWEQMLRRWMDNVGRFDKDVKEYVESGKAYLEANPPAPTYPVDPTEGEIWEMRHFFERDGEELDAIPGDLTPFYAVKEGRNVGMKQLFADGWVLMNDAGIEIDYDQAATVSRILKQHLKAEMFPKVNPEEIADDDIRRMAGDGTKAPSQKELAEDERLREIWER